MSTVEAIDADRNGRIVEAARRYEEILRSGAADADALLNLTILYWESTSMGFYAFHHLSEEFVALANNRYRHLLQEAELRFPSDPAVNFWRRYIASISEGIEFQREYFLGLRVAYPDYLEPEIMILDNGERSSRALALLNQCKKLGTTRARYVAAVLEGIFKRK